MYTYIYIIYIIKNATPASNKYKYIYSMKDISISLCIYKLHILGYIDLNLYLYTAVYIY